MAQHDYNIANQTGANFRADLNNALEAIATVNSGATEPATTFAHQLWVDTSSSELKIRNSDDNAWITTGVSITGSNTFIGNLTGNVTGNLTGNVTGNVTGDLTGNADSADTLSTARTISLSGDVVGSVSFDGSSNIDIDTVVQINSITLGTDTTGDYVESMSGSTGVTVTGGTGEGSTPSIAIGQAVATTDNVTFNKVTASNEFIGDIDGAVRFTAKTTEDLSKGDVVYVSGISGNTATVSKAKADDASKMPAFGLAIEDANANNNLQIVTLGNLMDIDTSNFSEGQILYVSTTAGEYTTTIPSGESSQIQNIGKVLRSHAVNGAIKVGGAGRSNATPNLDNGKIFIGNGSNQSTTATLDTSIVVENTNLYYTQSRFDSAFTAKSTSDLSEGTNLYYTTARANTDFDTRLATKDTGNLAEGSNLYYTDARSYTAFDTRLATKDTDDLSEGTNLYYTQARFDSAFGNKTTADLTENTNLYYTDTRANSAIDARVTKAFVDALNVQAASVDANSVTLGTDTVGNYIQTITGTANKITVLGSGSETADVTLSLPDDVQIADSLTVAGNLTVNGTLTSLDTTNLDIEDNLFQLNAGLTGSPVNDSGMLINRGNQDNGIIMWDESVDKFTMGLTTADGSATGNITLNSLGTLVVNVEGNLTGNVTGTVSSLSNHDTADLTEGSNLYYTDARAQAVSINNVVEDTTPQLGGNLASNGNDILFADNDKAIFGAGSDLQIYHTGSVSVIADEGTGNLLIRGSDLRLQNAAGSNNYFKATDGGAIELFNAGSTKLATTSTGIDVTGTATMDGLTVDGNADISGTITSGANNGAIKEIGSDLSLVQGVVGLRINDAASAISPTTASANNDNAVDLGVSNIRFKDIYLSGKLTNDGSGGISVDTSGNVGIGTSSPALQSGGTGLHVNGSSYSEIKFTNSSTGTAATDGTALVTNSLDFGINNREAGKLTFGTSNSTRMTIDSSGNVGIGMSNPADYNFDTGVNLVVGSSSTNGQIQVLSGTSGIGYLAFADGVTGAENYRGLIQYHHGSNYMGLRTNGNERMRIDSSGNVGIGGSPTAKLDVIGDGTWIRHSGYGQLLDMGNWTDGLVRIESTGAPMYIRASGSNYIALDTNSVERMRITAAGDLQLNSGAVNKGYIQLSTQSNLYAIMGGNYWGYLGYKTGGYHRWFGSDTSEHMRLDSSGNLLVGTTNNAPVSNNVAGVSIRNFGEVQSSVDGAAALYLNRKTSDGDIAVFRKDGSTVGTIGSEGGDSLYVEANNCGLRYSISNRIMPCGTGGSGRDNVIDLGSTGARFDDIYATNGTIQTSDRNEKQDIEALTDAETRVAVAAKGLLRKFRWIDSVEEKGDEARIHFGIIAQDLQDAFTAEGLDAGDYAMFISDNWTNDDGVEQTRLGVRYSELLAFIIASL